MPHHQSKEEIEQEFHYDYLLTDGCECTTCQMANEIACSMLNNWSGDVRMALNTLSKATAFIIGNAVALEGHAPVVERSSQFLLEVASDIARARAVMVPGTKP